MKTRTKSKRRKQPILMIMAISVFMFAANSSGNAQEANRTYQIGDQVEVRWAGDEKWYQDSRQGDQRRRRVSDRL